MRDLWQNGELMTAQDFAELYGVRRSIMEYNSIVLAIPKRWDKTYKRTTNIDVEYDQECLFFTFESLSCVCPATIDQYKKIKIFGTELT